MARVSEYEIEKAMGNDSSNGGAMTRERGVKANNTPYPAQTELYKYRDG